MATITAPIRVFVSGSMQLGDPDPSMPPDQVRQFYARSYPHLAVASTSAPAANDDGTVTYTFERAPVGVKGAAWRWGR